MAELFGLLIAVAPPVYMLLPAVFLKDEKQMSFLFRYPDDKDLSWKQALRG